MLLSQKPLPVQGPMGAALQGPSRPEERMMQARDTLSTDFKSMVSQVESNAGMQVGINMPPGTLAACSACQIPCPCAGAY